MELSLKQVRDSSEKDGLHGVGRGGWPFKPGMVVDVSMATETDGYYGAALITHMSERVVCLQVIGGSPDNRGGLPLHSKPRRIQLPLDHTSLTEARSEECPEIEWSGMDGLIGYVLTRGYNRYQDEEGADIQAKKLLEMIEVHTVLEVVATKSWFEDLREAAARILAKRNTP